MIDKIEIQNSNGTYSQYNIPSLEKLKQVREQSEPIPIKKPRKRKTQITSAIINKVNDLVFVQHVSKVKTARILELAESTVWRICKKLEKKHERNKPRVRTDEADQLRAQLRAVKQGLAYLLGTLG